MGGKKQGGGRQKPERKRSFGRRLLFSALIAVVAGVGVAAIILVAAWSATEMGIGAVRSAGVDAPPRSSFGDPAQAQRLALMAGAAVGGVTFLKELLN